MNKQQQLEEFRAFYEKAKDIMSRKGDDYAGEDRLDNFKVAGRICKITPAQQCLSLIATKVARLGTLLKQGVEARNEPLTDSIEDLIIYSFLLLCLKNEEETELKKELQF